MNDALGACSYLIFQYTIKQDLGLSSESILRPDGEKFVRTFVDDATKSIIKPNQDVCKNNRLK